MDLSELTTLRLGGPPRALVTARTEAELMAAVQEAEPPVLVLGGGSNVVAPDAGFDGTVVLVRTRGVREIGQSDRSHVLEVAAGEDWDAFVARCVAGGLAGVECLSGIPGSVGATPIQNVGAYGQDVAQTVVSVRVLEDGAVREMSNAECGFSYRSSVFKREPGRRVVLSVTFALRPSPASGPLRYEELRRAVGEQAPLAEVRDAVLALRRGKGMVLDPADHDTWSAGSFFTNPIVDAAPPGAPSWPEPDGRVKISAAWCIQQAGFQRGHGRPDGIALSSKHVLAITNRGGGTTAELVALKDEIQAAVRERLGIALEPEPLIL